MNRHTKHIILCFFTFCFSIIGTSQVNWVEGWSENQLKQAIVRGDSQMNEAEKEVIFYCNLVRIDPKKFMSTVLPKYVESREIENSSYLISLRRDLKKANELPPFIANSELSQVAKKHATNSGNKGTIGHHNYTQRFKHLNDIFSVDGENCDYGNGEAIDIVFSWLIDEGIADLGHRKNILDPDFTHTGVGISPHKEYGVNAVMAYGKME
ncbi:MAG: hypothetical protein CL833_14150 [Crocinitomicaceae bacterium]|nr:hypothetical protein [Crocinitomicaceae bacterium]